MNTLSVIREEDVEAVCDRAAQEFMRLAKEAISARGRFTIALSGGSTPRALYQMLSGRPLRLQVDWSSIDIFWGDERCVPPDDADSNFRMVREAMLEKLSIPESNIHRMEAERNDLETAAEDYQASIAQVLGADPTAAPPSLDLVLLGMGADGHTASLFPETRALEEKTRWVVANDVPQLGTRRMTLTAPLINAARSVIFLVAGSEKADRLAEVLCGPEQPHKLPSQLISPDSGTLTWLVDQAAARRLPASLSN